MFSMDDNLILDKIDAFSSKWTKKHPDRAPGYCHNMYYLVSEDRDGNITNEGFAVNVMTDYGVDQAYIQGRSYFDYYLWIGAGLTDPQPTSSSSMEDSIATTSAINSDTKWEYIDDRYYSDTQIVVSRTRALICYYDYTVFDENKTVTEIGVGTGRNNLIYHSRVYDAEGNPSSFVKKVNEKLTIYVYVGIACKMGDIIDRNWAKGIYTMFRPYYFFKKYVYDRWQTFQYFLKPNFRNDTREEGSATDNYSDRENGYTKTFSNNVLTVQKNTNAISFLITDKYFYISDVIVSGPNNGYYIDDLYKDQGWLMLYKPKLETPEKIESYNVFTDDCGSTQLKYVFGYGTDNRDKHIMGYIPVTDFDISGTDAGMWMYNCQDDDWNIPETFVNAKNACYDCEYLIYSISHTQYVDFLQANRTFRIYLNHRNDIPITKIDKPGYTFYATDRYWDPSSWELILDINNLPQSAQNKRFYITFTDSFKYTSGWPYNSYADGSGYNLLPVVRNQTYHSIQPKTPYYYCDYGKTSSQPRSDGSSRAGKCVSDNTYGYIATLGWLMYPETDDPNPTTYTDASATNNEFWYRYPLNGTGNIEPHSCLLWNTKNGDKIIVQGNESWNNGFRVYTPNVDPSIAPTYEDVLVGDNTTFADMPHWSYSDEGYVAMSYITGSRRVNQTFILDVYGTNGPEIKTLNDHKCAHIVDLTHYICALNTNITDHLSFDVIDMRTMTVEQTFDFPAGVSFKGMCAYDDFIYIRVVVSSTNTMYLYRISTQTLVALTFDSKLLDINTSSYYRHIQRAVRSVGNCPAGMVMLGSYESYDSSTSRHILFNSTIPEKVTNLFNFDGDGHQSLWAGIRNQAADMKYTNDNKQLLLVFANRRNHVVDMGRLLNKQTQETANYTLEWRKFYNEEPDNGYAMTVYKNSIALLRPYYREGSWSSDYTWRTAAYIYPIESFVPHKVIGYTKTICSYNNPKRVSSCKGMKFQFSNDITQWTPPVGE